MAQGQKKTASRLVSDIWDNTVSEWTMWMRGLHDAEFNVSLAFALFCVLVVIIGNVVLLIAINFWLSIFPQEEMATNSSQIAVQVVVCTFLVMCFCLVGVVYVVIYGVRPLLRALVATNRVRGPLYRLLLLFASGATNGLTGVLAIYSMSHTPEFLQAVLLSVIPFCAQLWTFALVPEERKRRYGSLTLIASLLCCVAGVLLSSMSSFLDSSTGRAAPWNWALVYLASAVVFGLWCVVQRLYLDAIMLRHSAAPPASSPDMASIDRVIAPPGEREVEPVFSGAAADDDDAAPAKDDAMDDLYRVGTSDTAEASLSDPLLLGQRKWGKQNKDDFAAKTVLLLVGVLFQTLVSFALLPVDAIPWFGTSSNVSEAWHGFRDSCDFIFDSWENVRYGMLHTLGFFMSFIGCAYLNERSPTLASVVLQMASPVTGIVLIIVPKWDVYGAHGNVGHQVGGIVLLLLAGLFYHVWDTASLQEMLERQEVQQQQQQYRDDVGAGPEVGESCGTAMQPGAPHVSES